jgi:hypothetical protein
VRSPYFQNLRALQLYEDGNGWLDTAMPAIVESLPVLEVLDLELNTLDRKHLSQLLAGAFPELVELRLAYCRLDEASIRAIAKAPLFATTRPRSVVNLVRPTVVDAMSAHHTTRRRTAPDLGPIARVARLQREIPGLGGLGAKMKNVVWPRLDARRRLN